MENKLKELLNYSNPTTVKNLGVKLLGKEYPILISSRKDKKYMVKSPDGKWIHFGGFNPPMEDYTKTRNEEKRNKFRKRNAKWNNQTKWSAGWLSFNLLW